MQAWRGREGFVVQKLNILFHLLGWGFAWIAIFFVTLVLVHLFADDGGTLRENKFFLAGVGIASLGLIFPLDWLRRKYLGLLFGLVWITIISLLIKRFYIDDRDTLRGIGLFFAGVGIAPLGLILAYFRTNHQRKELASEDYGRSVKMLGGRTANVRQSGVYSLRNLVRGNDHLYKAILRVIASFARTQSMDFIRREVFAKDESVSTAVDIEWIRKIADEKPMPPDAEAAITMIKEIINEGKGKFEKIVKDCDLGEYTIDLSDSILLNGALSRTSVKKANFSQSRIFGFDFRHTDFSDANLVASHFENCSFVGCNFEKAEMGEVRIVAPECPEENPFEGANFKDAEIHGADLKSAYGITQSQIDDAIGDVNTKLPRGLEWPKCWKVIPESTA